MAGDYWQPVKNAETGHFAIRHEPNLALGSQVLEVDIADFLNRNGRSPQAEALRVLLTKQNIMDMEDE